MSPSLWIPPTVVLLKESSSHEPDFITCKCGHCGTVARYADCKSYQDQESWEIPTPYTVHICPVCERDEMEPHSYEDMTLEEAWANFKIACHREAIKLLMRWLLVWWAFCSWWIKRAIDSTEGQNGMSGTRHHLEQAYNRRQSWCADVVQDLRDY